MIDDASVDGLTDDEAKELFAHFGLAYYFSSVLEHGVVNALLILEIFDKRRNVKTHAEWEMLVDAHFDSSFAKTLGRLKTQLARHNARSTILSNLITDLDRCVEERNFLAHHFWRDCSIKWFTRDGREEMNHRLEGVRDLFRYTDKQLEAAIQPFAKQHGITPELLQQTSREMKREYLESSTNLKVPLRKLRDGLE
jgi:hypothetical protein